MLSGDMEGRGVGVLAGVWWAARRGVCTPESASWSAQAQVSERCQFCDWEQHGAMRCSCSIESTYSRVAAQFDAQFDASRPENGHDIGVVILALVIIAAIAAPLIDPGDPTPLAVKQARSELVHDST